MNKKKILILLFFLFLANFAFSIPTITVSYPNGNEVLSGTNQILFTAKNSVIVDPFDANICLTFTAGQCDTATIDSVDLLDICSFENELNWQEKNTMVSGLTGIYIVDPHFFYVDSKYHILYKDAYTTKAYISQTWNTTAWTFDSDYNAGLRLTETTPISKGNLEIFDLGGSIYALDSQNLDASKIEGYLYNSTANAWQPNWDINSGFTLTAGLYPSVFFVEDYLSKDWLILSQENLGTTPQITSYYWDSTNTIWIQNNLLSNNFTFLDPSTGFDEDNLLDATFFKYNSVLYSLQTYQIDSGGGYGGYAAGLYFNQYTGWQINTDFNSIETFSTFNSSHGLFHNVLTIDGNLTLFTSRFYDVNHYQYYSAPNTTETQNCIYSSFDTTLYANGTYYIDVNATDSLGLSHEDSSNNYFSILNWNNSDINCTCISNCSSCVLDVNSFIVIPTVETTDIVIKIVDGNGAKNVGYKIRNANDSGNQYKINKASIADYSDGIWNYSNSLSFGTTNYDAVQKIWQNDLDYYEYFFDDTILSHDTIYYKFDYYQPAYHYFSLTDSADWDNQLTPDKIDYNGLVSDFFQISNYSNMASFLTKPFFPSITSNLANKNYVLQFTARSDALSSSLVNAGLVSLRENSPSTALNLTTGYKTLTIADISGGYVKIKSNAVSAKELWFQNYAISERGFFTKGVDVYDSDGLELPVMIGDNNHYLQYVIEGKNFMVESQYYDPDGVIERLEISAYIDSTDAANKVKKWVFDVSDESDLVDISETIGGLVDLTANAPNRTVILTMRLVDTNSSYYEIVSENLTLRQFPNDAKELLFSLTETNKKIGDNPEGRFTLETIAPENLIGIEYQIRDMVSDNNNADYNKTFYKNVDFVCNAFDCSFDYKIIDYIFPTSGNFRIEAWALVSTEIKSNQNDLLYDFKSIPISWITLSTARIFQTHQRSTRTYRNDEIIPLTVQLQASTPISLKNIVNVKIQLGKCDNNTDCSWIDLNYSPDSFLYDADTKYNYWNFRQIFVNTDYSQLADNTSYRVRAFIEDSSKTLQTVYQPVLADKCQTIDTDNFWANAFNMNFYKTGCSSFTDTVVAIPDNNSQEEHLWINVEEDTSDPYFLMSACISPDTNYGVSKKTLAQDILCYTFYLFKEKPIDKFIYTLGNVYSDYAEEKYKQYLKVEVPYELIYFNDLDLMKRALQAEYSTDSISNIYEFISLSADKFLGFLAPTFIPATIDDAGNAFLSTGIIGNVGFNLGHTYSNDQNFNFYTPLDPNSLSGIIITLIRGVNVVNVSDYLVSYPEVDSIDKKRFLEYLDFENIPVKSKTTTIDIYTSNWVKVKSYKLKDLLVIDEDIKLQQSINPISNNPDANKYITSATTPIKLSFNFISDMIYGNEQYFQSRTVILPFSAILPKENFCGLFGINCLLKGGSGSIIDLVLYGDLSFFAKNWFLIFMLMIGVLFISVVYSNLKKGGINIKQFFAKKE